MTSNEALKKYGIPTPQNEGKYMMVWMVPQDILKEFPHVFFSAAGGTGFPKKIYINKDFKPFVEKALRNVIDRGLQKELKTWDGCFVVRSKRLSTSYSMHCLPEDQMVWLKDGIKSIKDIKVGDNVLSVNENNLIEEKPVLEIFKNGVKKILKLNIANNSIRCSENHKVMVITKTTLPKEKWIKKDVGRGSIRALYDMEMKEAKDLRKGDRIVVLKNLPMFSNTDNLDWFEILGMFMGDGCFHNRRNGGYNYVSFHFPKDDRVRSYVKNILERNFKSVKESNKAFFLYTGEDYEQFRKYNFKAKTKFIPTEVFNASFEQKIAFIKGLIYSDGYITKVKNKLDSNKYTVVYNIKLANEYFIQQLKNLCSQVGFKTSNIVYEKPGEKIIKGIKTKSSGSWKLSITDYNKFISLDGDFKYREAQENSVKFKTYNSFCWGYEHLGENLTHHYLRAIEEDGEEEVYDIMVEDNHNFIVNGVVVSNSWGLAIDINASENRQGTEGNLSPEFVKCFTDAGLEWGGMWTPLRIKDPMHFQIK